jgi:hypothetical protein
VVTWSVIALVGAWAITGTGCGGSSGAHKDAGMSADVPISSGGAPGVASTGGAAPTGGAGGSGGAAGATGTTGSGGTSSQPVDGSVAIDGTGQAGIRDGTKVQIAVILAAQVWMRPSAPFLLRADLSRTADGRFTVDAKVQISVSGCAGEACNQQLTMTLSREQTTQVESQLAVIPGIACQDDPGPVCDFAVHYTVGIDGPPQKQTCCKRNEWGQNGNVTGLHSYLQTLALAQLVPVDGGSG